MEDLNSEDLHKLNKPGCSLESDAEEDYQVPPKRNARRSSFFRRRSSIFVPETMDSLEDSTSCTQTMNNTVSEEITQMKEYVEELEKEKKDWLKVHKDFKEKYRLLNKAPVSKTVLLDQESCSQYLTEEDKIFFAEKPNYRGVCKLLDQTIETLALATTKINQCKQLSNNFSNIVDSKLIDVKRECIQRLEMDSFKSEEYDSGNASMQSVLDDSFIE